MPTEGKNRGAAGSRSVAPSAYYGGGGRGRSLSITPSPHPATRSTTSPDFPMNFRIPALALTLVLSAAAPLCAQVPAADTAAENARQRAARLRIRTAFREAMAAQGIATSDALLLLTRPQRGTPVQVRVLEGTVPPPVLAALDSVVQNQVGPWSTPYVNMMLRPGEELEFGDSATVVRPDLRNRGYLTTQLSRYLERNPEVGVPGQRIDMAVRALVSRTGAIPYVELTRSSGRLQIDQEVMAIVRRMRVRPARIGNHPVDVWVSLPVALQIPQQLPSQSQPGRPPVP